MQTLNSTSMGATRRTPPRIQAAPGLYGLTKQGLVKHGPGQPEAAWNGKPGKVQMETGIIA